MTKREIAGRYRGSLLGVAWSLLTPIFMLAIFTFVFGAVFRSRWGAGQEEATTGEFAVILFAGLIVFQFFAEVINRSPGLVLANANYVKKVVFPLEILVPVAMLAALFHTAVSYVVLFGFLLAVHGSIPPTALLLPAILAPYCLLVTGLAWFLSSLGVYYRDIAQVLGTLVTALMFLSPIFYPVAALPEWLRPWVALNPIAMPVEETRNVVIFGLLPDLAGLAWYSLLSLVVAAFGLGWFALTRKGFADVL
jgi:lipopolysaccharide transport system permease protein